MALDRTSRAQECLLGQLAGAALGSLVEFQSPDKIRCSYPGNGDTHFPQLKDVWEVGFQYCWQLVRQPTQLAIGGKPRSPRLSR